MVAVVAAGLGLSGCGSGDQLPVYPVKGEVRLDGEPTDGAFLVFHPVAGAATEGDKKTGDPIKPKAVVKSDGSFQLTTYDTGDGAPKGDYAVTVEWNKLVKKGNDVSAGPNVIPTEYAQPQTTPIKVTLGGATDLEPITIKKSTKKTTRR